MYYEVYGVSLYVVLLLLNLHSEFYYRKDKMRKEKHQQNRNPYKKEGKSYWNSGIWKQKFLYILKNGMFLMQDTIYIKADLTGEKI